MWLNSVAQMLTHKTREETNIRRHVCSAAHRRCCCCCCCWQGLSSAAVVFSRSRLFRLSAVMPSSSSLSVAAACAATIFGCLGQSWSFNFGCLGRSLTLPLFCLRFAFVLPLLRPRFPFALPSLFCCTVFALPSLFRFLSNGGLF